MVVVVETATPCPGPLFGPLFVVALSGDKSNISVAPALGASAAQAQKVKGKISFRIMWTLPPSG
jgi:hypothetical protein